MTLSMIFITLMVLGATALVYSTFKLLQLHKFGLYMDNEIQVLFSSNLWLSKSLDIEKSYDNLGKSKPWDYNFMNMVVYYDLP